MKNFPQEILGLSVLSPIITPHKIIELLQGLNELKCVKYNI